MLTRDRQFWENGREAPRTDPRAGDTIIYDFYRAPVGLIDRPFHDVHFCLSRAMPPTPPVTVTLSP